MESSFARSEFVLINLEEHAPLPEIDSLSTAGDSAWSLPKNFPSLLTADRQVCIGYQCSFKGQERMPSTEVSLENKNLIKYFKQYQESEIYNV